MSAAHTIRPSAVAGSFYPGEAHKLQTTVNAYLSAAESASKHVAALRPKALIVPHAGYIYSASTAASAYKLLLPLRGLIKRVVLIGPAHRVAVPGLAVATASAFHTPLGDVPLDTEAIDALLHLPNIIASDLAHADEHSLEVHLPFLQTVLGDFSLVPLVVGGARPSETALALEAVWGGEETLILVSSDLSHFLHYDMAQSIDHITTESILHLQPLFGHEQACGATAINALIEIAQNKHLHPHLLAQCNSGDTAGDRDRVVGYAAFAFTEN